MQYFALDDFGNVTGTFRDSVTEVQSISYDDWGDATAVGDAVNRLMWKGRPTDSHLWLSEVRARWYDPVLGRFMSEDPIGLAGGINPYLFANDDPVNGRDPSGMYIGMPDDGDDDINQALHVGGSGDPCVSKSLVSYNIETGAINGVLATWDECHYAPVSLTPAGKSAGGGAGKAKPKPKPTSPSKFARTNACFGENHFSTLFAPGSNARAVAQFAEILPPAQSAANLLVRGSTGAAEHKADAVLIEKVIPTLTSGFISSFGKAVVRFETGALNVATAFTVSYNATTYVECALGVIP